MNEELATENKMTEKQFSKSIKDLSLLLFYSCCDIICILLPNTSNPSR